MIVLDTPHVISSETESNIINCLDFKNCANCTNKSICSWSLKKQSCGSTLEMFENQLLVHNETQCPSFSVVGKSTVTDVPFNYTVRISNDVVEFKQFLRSTKILCCFFSCEEFSVEGRIVNDYLICNAIEAPSFNLLKHSLKTTFYHVYISFNNVQLKLDNGLDHYVNIYTHNCNNKENDDCVTCLWNANDYRYYLKWCSSRNQCVGLSQHFEKRDNNDYSRLWPTDDTEPIECADLMIKSFDPLFAPFAGSVNMRIKVNNHSVAAENKPMAVTVAGRTCANPKTIDRETIGCTVSWTNGSERNAGPVEVVYASSTMFKLTSSDTFEFAEPEISGVRPVCGPTGGGTTLTVSGDRLDVGRAVRVSVGENNVTCATISRDRNSITCLTGRGGVPTAGAAAVTVEFDNVLSRYAPSPSFVYTADPTVDAGQSFASIATGGTTVPVRGRRFSCIERPQIHVDHRGVRHFAGCRVVNDTYMECRSPEIESLSADMTPTKLHFGFQVDYADRVTDILPQPEFPKLSFHPDPLFTDFEIGENAVVINGRDLNRGYRIDDLAVRFSNNSGADCVVTFMTRYRIECTPTLPHVLDEDLRVIVLSIGDKFVRNVKRKSTLFSELLHYLFMVTNIGTAFGLFILIACVLIICATNQIVR